MRKLLSLLSFVAVNFLALNLSLAGQNLGTDPFDDLSADEMSTAIAVIRESGRFEEAVRFPVVRRLDPPKHEWLNGGARDFRKAYIAVFEGKKSLLSEMIIDLKTKKIESVHPLPGLKPPVLLEEYDRARRLILADERWRSAVRARGFQNLDDLWVDLWAPGLIRADEMQPGQRLLRGLTYFKGKSKNFYARPLEGLVVTVDLSQEKVVSVWNLEHPPVASGAQDLKSPTRLPHGLKPLEITQREGSSIEVHGQELKWNHWKMRFSMDPLQGLQLYHIRFEDEGKERSIIYRISLADMLVPYGDPSKSWSYRNAFDVGEYGLGKTLHPLQAGQDVPENALLFDVAIADDLGGAPRILPGIAAYERDSGLLWKHRDSESGEASAARGRQLVVTYMTTIGNYDYGVNYIFDLDGTIHVEPQLTGILLARGTELTRNSCANGCKPLVEKNILAPPHQHFFNFRIDFDIDGALNNRAAEVNVRPVPKGELNPDANVFEAVIKELEYESQGVRDWNPKSARKWKIFSSTAKNNLAHPTGYALVPGETAYPYLDKSNPIRQQRKASRSGSCDVVHVWRDSHSAPRGVAHYEYSSHRVYFDACEFLLSKSGTLI